MSDRKLTRRQFLYSSALAAAGATLAACAAPAATPVAPVAAPTAPAAPAAPAAPRATPTTVGQQVGVPTAAPVLEAGIRYSEAPMLAEMVARGDLPPVDERLPQNPLVLTPIEGIGNYGGTLRAVVGGLGSGWAGMMQYGTSPVHWINDGLGISEGHISAWSTNEDNSEWTFSFRRGMKWSDGEPCGVDDVLFWWNDLVLNPSFPDAPPNWALARGKLLELVKVDDHTLKMEFDSPAPLTLRQLCNWPNSGTGPRWIAPAHYCKQFHPGYNSNVKTFDELTDKINWHMNPECPTIAHWKCDRFEAGVGRTMVRNPYYWCVDPAGNQLPYIDRTDETMIADPEVQKLTIMQGGADFSCHGTAIFLADLATLRENEERGGYEVRLWDSGDGTGRIIYPNHDYPEEKYRNLFRDTKFLQALSHAHDRATIQRLVYFNTGMLSTGTYSPKSIEFNFNEEAQRFFIEARDKYVEYDPEKSKALLDELGLKDLNGDGFRQFPDGSPLEMRVDISATASSDGMKVLELFERTWTGVGLKVVVNTMPGPEFGLFWRSGQGMIRTDWEVGDGPDHLTFPSWVVPDEPTRWAPLSGNMLELMYKPKASEELDVDPWGRTPPRFAASETDLIGETVLKLHEIYLAAREEPDELKRHSMVWDIVRVHMDRGPLYIGCVANIPRLLIVSKKLMNVPTREQLALNGFVTPWIMAYPGITNTETYAFKS